MKISILKPPLCLQLKESYLFPWPQKIWFLQKHRIIGDINPSHANVQFRYTLKTSENQRFTEVFKGYRNGTLAWNGLRERFILDFWNHTFLQNWWPENQIKRWSFLSKVCSDLFTEGRFVHIYYRNSWRKTSFLSSDY